MSQVTVWNETMNEVQRPTELYVITWWGVWLWERKCEKWENEEKLVYARRLGIEEKWPVRNAQQLRDLEEGLSTG